MKYKKYRLGDDPTRYGIQFGELEVGDTFYISPSSTEPVIKIDEVREYIVDGGGGYSTMNARWKSRTLNIYLNQLVWVSRETLDKILEREAG